MIRYLLKLFNCFTPEFEEDTHDSEITDNNNQQINLKNKSNKIVRVNSNRGDFINDRMFDSKKNYDINNNDQRNIEKYRLHKIYQKFYIGNEYYINDLGTKRILFKKYIDDKFPLKGWFHECLNCYSPTGQSYQFKEIYPKNVHVQICPKCKQKLDYQKKINSKDYKDFIKEINYSLQNINKRTKYFKY